MTSMIRGAALLNVSELVSSLGGDAEIMLRARGVDPAAAGMGPDLAVVDHVRDLTRRLLAVDQASLIAAARAMSLHPRVLQRRLAEAGTTFEEILDEVRRELAWQLSATGMQVSRIASSLGYSEQSSYTRACRRWYGESPRQLRARRRVAPSHGK